MRAIAIALLLLVVRSIEAASPASADPRGADRAAGDRASERATETDDPIADGDDDLAGPRIPVVGPSIGAVLSASYAAAGLDRDPAKSWIRRARIAGLIPWVTVRTARDTSWQDEHAEVGHGTSLEVRATWRLDRLLFDSHELQVAGIEAARRRERRRLATRVIHAYFAWRRAAGGSAGAGDDRATVRIAETTAELDALTDGWFSDEVSRLRRDPSDPRSPRTRPAAAP